MAMSSRKKTPYKRRPARSGVKRTAMRKRVPRSLHPASAYKMSQTSRDGTKLVLCGFLEAEKILLSDAAANTQMIQWSLNTSSLNPLITKGAGVTLKDADGVSALNNDHLTLERGADVAANYRQYRVDRMEITVASNDQDHPIVFTQDRETATVIPNMGDVLSGPHKAMSLSASRKTCKYGWTAKDSPSDQEFLPVTTLQKTPARSCFIKCYQRIDAPKQLAIANGAGGSILVNDGKQVRHSIAVKAYVTFRDLN